MAMWHKRVTLILVIFCITSIFSEKTVINFWEEEHKTEINKILGGFSYDLYHINRNIFTENSLKIVAAFSPFYITARFIDEDIHDKFYDPKNHKNKNQTPKFFKFMAGEGVAVPLITVIAVSLLSPNKEKRRTGFVFLETMLSAYVAKVLIKKVFETNASLRPLNGDFSKKRVHGGFPSGHMVEMSIVTSLYALRFGPKWGMPLAAMSSIVFISSVNYNRHYVSQVFAGAALGTMFGVAANKFLKEERSPDDFSLSVAPNFKGGLNFNLSYSF